MFDALLETKIASDGKVTVKRWIADEGTAPEMEMPEGSLKLDDAEIRKRRNEC